MSINGFNRTLLSFALISSISIPAVAASQCKGLEASACQENQACTWVSAYTTKNGNTVSAYCRAASGKAKKEVNTKKEQEGAKTGFNTRSTPSTIEDTFRDEKYG